MKKRIFKLLWPVIWILLQLLGLIPGIGKIIKGVMGNTKVRGLEKRGEYDDARKLRAHLLNKYPTKYLGPLWRSEGDDQLYNQKNYEKALEAFEKAISCIEGKSYVSAVQYGVTQPIQAYYGAAASALYIPDLQKAEAYYKNFCGLVESIKAKDKYQDQYNWLKKQIEALKFQANNIN